MTDKLEGDATDKTDVKPGDDKSADLTADKAAADSTQTDKTDKGASSDENWEKRFKGLQPIHQTLVESNQNLVVQVALDKKDRDTKEAEFDVKITGLEGDLKTATESSEGLTKSNTELEKTIESLNTQAERNKMIMSDYPDLAVLEAQGLIRKDLEGDELTTALDSMRSLMVAKGKDAISDLSIGSSDADLTTGNRSQGKDVSSIGDLLMIAQKNRDVDEITRLSDLLVKQADIEVFQDQNASS
ncbi:MAG: hypothetical protein KAJ73_03190 [Zetaproteobacteria bacterium]|nr:hypothetical protein [Zetaproteobacteria bacterium]